MDIPSCPSTRTVVGDEREQFARGGDRLVSDGGDAFEEEAEPALPVAVDGNRAEAAIVRLISGPR